VFLNSNYHLEHHYFPGVPFYRLAEVQRALVPFYEKKNMRWRTYSELVYGWLVLNQAPHTNWDGEPAFAGASAQQALALGPPKRRSREGGSIT
jgi:hypothetical protein